MLGKTKCSPRKMIAVTKRVPLRDCASMRHPMFQTSSPLQPLPSEAGPGLRCPDYPLPPCGPPPPMIARGAAIAQGSASDPGCSEGLATPGSTCLSPKSMGQPSNMNLVGANQSAKTACNARPRGGKAGVNFSPMAVRSPSQATRSGILAEFFFFLIVILTLAIYLSLMTTFSIKMFVSGHYRKN